MPIADLAGWRRELLSVCALEIDDAAQEETERRYHRYVELADLVGGDEGPTAVHALIASLSAEEDYGAHQAAYGALERFPPGDLVAGTVLAVADLLALPRDNSGQVLQLLTLVAAPSDLEDFQRGSNQCDPGLRHRLSSLIRDHEHDEWLADERSAGKLRVAAS